MFRNLIVYRVKLSQIRIVPSVFSLTLQPQAFTPCGSLDDTSQGWVPPVEGGALAHVVNKQIILHLKTEKKLLPPAVIKEATRIKCAEHEETHGYKPGRRQTREIKEQVIDELLPRAFSTSTITRVWLDPVNGWLGIDTPSQSRAEEVLLLLIKAIEKFPVEPVRVAVSPRRAMTSWLNALLYSDDDGLPRNMSIDNNAEIRTLGEGKPVVKYVRNNLDGNLSLDALMRNGGECVNLALTWNDRISFTLTEGMQLKSIEMLDILKETNDEPKDAQERFDADFTLMAGEFAVLLADLVANLGGEVTE